MAVQSENIPTSATTKIKTNVTVPVCEVKKLINYTVGQVYFEEDEDSDYIFLDEDDEVDDAIKQTNETGQKKLVS